MPQIVSWLLGGIALPVLLYSIRLVTEVRSDGLYLRFFPFHLSYERFPIDGIRSYEAITYSPLREYGGWGIRYGWNGKAYNVSGNQGIQLELSEGKRILIGTQHPLEFLSALQSLGTATQVLNPASLRLRLALPEFPLTFLLSTHEPV